MPPNMPCHSLCLSSKFWKHMLSVCSLLYVLLQKRQFLRECRAQIAYKSPLGRTGHRRKRDGFRGRDSSYLNPLVRDGHRQSVIKTESSLLQPSAESRHPWHILPESYVVTYHIFLFVATAKWLTYQVLKTLNHRPNKGRWHPIPF